MYCSYKCIKINILFMHQNIYVVLKILHISSMQLKWEFFAVKSIIYCKTMILINVLKSIFMYQNKYTALSGLFFNGSYCRHHPDWKKNHDQTCSCPRGWRLPAIRCAQFRTPPETSQHYCIEGAHYLVPHYAERR